MEELILKQPTPEDEIQVMQFRQEFIDAGEVICGGGGLDEVTEYKQWLDKVEKYKSIETLPPNRVPTTQFLTIRKSDNKIVGIISVRHYLNEALLIHGGHIGDSILPSERKKGYATKQIQLALDYCRSLGIDKVLMSCTTTNIGSEKSITKNGGVLENQIECDGKVYKRFWIEL